MRLFRILPAGLALLAACGAEPPEPPDPASAAGWTLKTTGDLNGFFDCLDAQDRALVSAHRGGPAPGFPENAVETFARTLSLAPALIEFDVATSADGVLYLMHDDTLERTTNGVGEADALPWSAIRRLNLIDVNAQETEFHPASFAAALAFLKDRTITQIDFKRTTRYEDVVEEVRRQGAEDRVIYIAYSLAQAQKLHRLAPASMISLSIDNEEELDQAVAAGVPDDRLLAFTGLDAPNPRLAAVLDAEDVEVIFGTLGWRDSIDQRIARDGDEESYAEIAGLGVDIIATDRPVAAHRALAEAGRGAEAGLCGVSRF